MGKAIPEVLLAHFPTDFIGQGWVTCPFLTNHQQGNAGVLINYANPPAAGAASLRLTLHVGGGISPEQSQTLGGGRREENWDALVYSQLAADG